MRLDFIQDLAAYLARRTLSALRRVLDDPAVSLDDQTAACLVAERVTLAAVTALIAFLTAADEQADGLPPRD